MNAAGIPAAPAWPDEAAFAAALLDPAAACPPGLLAWNGSDPAQRLAVHRNNVIASLVNALAESFPVCQTLVGDEFFRAMAALFVRQSPPHSRVLAHYGEHLPAFIEGFAPARPVPALADLARLEWARQFACHAADAPVLDAAAVTAALAAGDRVSALRLGCQPSLSVLRSPHPVVSLWAAHQLDTEAERDAALSALDMAQPESAMVLRDGWDVLVVPLAPGAAACLAALQQGLPLAEAAACGQHDAADFDLAGLLALLRGHGALTSIALPPEDPR